MTRRKLDAGGRHKIGEGVVRLRQMRMHRAHHFAQGVGTGDGQHLRVHGRYDVLTGGILFGAQATGDDHLTVFGQRLADGVEAFLNGVVDEAASIDHHEIGTVIGTGDVVTFGTQLRQDLLGVDQRLGASERNEADLGGAGGRWAGHGAKS